MIRSVRRFKLKKDYVPDQTAIDYFNDNGHVIFENVVSHDEIHQFSDLVEKTVDKYKRHEPIPGTINIRNLCPEAKSFITSSRFAAIAAKLIGADQLRLYMDVAYYKYPNEPYTVWHTDNTYILLDTDNTVQMYMPLVELTEEMGGSLEYISGSHLLKAETDQKLSREVLKKNLPRVNYGSMKPGEAIFHSGKTLHYAPVNRSNRVRKAVTFFYFSGEARYVHMDNLFDRFFPMYKDGDMANRESVNPTVYKKDTTAR